MQKTARSTSTHRITFIPALLCFCSLVAHADGSAPVSTEALSAEPAITVVTTEIPGIEAAPQSTPESTPQSTPGSALFAAAQPVPAATTQVTEPQVESAEEDSPYRLRRALRERDISFGFGQKFPISRFDRRTDVTLFQFLPRWGRFRDDRQEFLWEVPITIATKPETAYAAGLTLMYRYHFSSNRRFAPFVEAGGGFVITNFHSSIKELNGAFQFSPQAGIGVRTALSESSDLILSARWYHLSNAGTRKPNVGLNNYLVTVGYSRLF